MCVDFEFVVFWTRFCYFWTLFTSTNQHISKQNTTEIDLWNMFYAILMNKENSLHREMLHTLYVSSVNRIYFII